MKYLFIFLSIFSLLNCKEINQDITITFTIPNEQYISDENGVFCLKSNFDDSNDLFDNNDIEEKTIFDMEISGSSKTYPMKCRLFKGEYKTIILICNLNGGIEKSESVTIKKTKNLLYKENNVILDFNVEDCTIKKANYKIPFLYSAEKKINIQENQKIINLEYRCESYNNEPLILDNGYSIVPLKNCQKNGKILKCEALVEDINKISKAQENFLVRYFHDIIGTQYFKFVAVTEINYNNINKENIYLKIEKPPIYSQIAERYYFTFPTNITNIPKIKTLPFETRISNIYSDCLLIKHNEVTPLYLLCSIRESKSFNIIDFEGFEEKDLNYKYNFILETVKINAKISYINEEFNNVVSIYPETLDFSKVDSLKIYLNTDKHFENSIRLNEAGNDIVCEKIEEEKSMFVCKVPKSHFNGAKTGYYLIREKSRVNGYMAHYETFGVNYALSKSQAKILSSSIFLFGLLCLILF